MSSMGQPSWTIMAARSTSLSALTYGADRQTAAHPAQPLEKTVPAWQAAADETVAIVKETGIDPAHFVDPLRDLFGHWTRKMDRRHSAFNPMLKMMASAVMHRLELFTGNGVVQA